MDKKKVKRFIGKSVAVLAVAFAILSQSVKKEKLFMIMSLNRKIFLRVKRSFSWKTRMIRKMLTA